MTLTINYLDNGTINQAQYNGDWKDALFAGEYFLDAAYNPEEECWTYTAPETGEVYVLTDEDVARAGAAVLLGVPDWYSLWAASCGAPAR